MLKLVLVAHNHVEGSSEKADFESVERTVQWPVVPRVGETLDLGRHGPRDIVAVYHSIEDAEPAFQISFLVKMQDEWDAFIKDPAWK